MHFDIELFFRALGLAFVMEGLCWAVFPKAMGTAMLQLLHMPTQQVRTFGLLAVVLGTGLVWLVTK